MPVDNVMKCPGCDKLIPRYFTWHDCGWKKPGTSVPHVTPKTELAKPGEVLTVDQFTKRDAQRPSPVFANVDIELTKIRTLVDQIWKKLHPED